ncbi:DUF4153 domain-containing protein [Anaerosalibacter bizertensis]|uniref:DUF4153 domain-containing protein n=1 Tax=Anaerosalibacter bizertensis TaxID=932217 RepID=UPI001C0EFB19|nr:DUF4153 domain-containing protein [Anaerosalibacter bizertensis]MBU5292513.1 DUF4153 domain-containing protein [Anaerosalibacter bizertensis]
MVNIKLKNFLKDSVKSIYESTKRFPITIGVCILLVIMLIITNENQSNLSKEAFEIIQRINMIISLGIPLSLCFKLIFEKKDMKKLNEVFIYILGIGALVLYYFYLLNDFKDTSIIRYIGLSIFLYLGFLYIPWLGNKKHYENYIIKVLGNFFLTVIYAVVIYFGFSAIIFTIDKLFSINIEWKIYYYMALIVFIVLMPSMFLAKIPYNNHDFSKVDYPKALKVLLLYIVIPLITIYTTILYAYFIKIIVTRNWPEGLVSHLVLWYSVITVGVVFFIHPLVDKNKLAKVFTFWIPKIIIPIIFMMFVSIGIRIREYGITENRYFVLVLGIWVLGIMIYFSAARKMKNIIIPISLSIIVLNAVFGPLSSFSISKYSQNKRFEEILVKNNMLYKGKIVKPKAKLPEKDKIEMSMILSYFKDKHSLNNVKYLPNNFETDDMTEVFGFPYTFAENGYGKKYHYFASDKLEKTIEIKDYDYLVSINDLINSRVEIKISEKINCTVYNHVLKIKDGEDIIYEKNIEEFIKIIFNKYNNELDNSEINIEDMTFEDENEKVKIKFIFNNISLESSGEGLIENINDIGLDIVLKIK